VNYLIAKTSKKHETNIEEIHPQDYEEEEEIPHAKEEGDEEGTERAYEEEAEEPEEEEEKQLDLDQEEFIATGRGEEHEEEDIEEGDSRTTEKMINKKEAGSSKRTQSKEIRRSSSPLLEEHKFDEFLDEDNENIGGIENGFMEVSHNK